MARGFLKIVAGAREGLNVPLPLREVLTIGRKNGELLLEDPLVSSRHCQVSTRNGEYVLTDLGSTNGTLVDGRLVREIVLKPGNEITVGSTRLILFVGAAETSGESEEPAPAPAAPSAPLDIAWLREEELVELAGNSERTRSPADVIGQDLRLPPGLNALVEVVAGQDTGKVFRFTRGNVNIGRRAGEVPLSDGEVSRRHSVIELFGREMIFLRDLGSTNGTYHNGRRVAVSRLRTGDTIGIGKTVLKLVVNR
jgi:pSer/pThr/pTyr-binding forkhead associated (FHA) protein